MNIAIGSTPWEKKFKNHITEWLVGKGNYVEDVELGKDADYPDYAFAVGLMVAEGDAELGILVSGTAADMCIAANKVKGVLAVTATYGSDLVRRSRSHNDSNVLCISTCISDARFRAKQMISAWMQAEFEGGRHQRRVEKITAYEQGQY